MSSHAALLRAPAPADGMPPSPRPATVRALFHVTAAADPGLLPRLVEPVAKLGHVPSRLHASSESGDGTELAIDLRLAGVPRRAAELVERQLRGLIGVRQVIAVIEAE